MRILCTKELHTGGGPGRYVMSRAESLMDSLVAEYGGKVQVIYLDPPFGTGETFRLQLGRGRKSLSFPAYEDKLTEEGWITLMRRVLTGCRELLSDTGSLYLHVDYRMTAQARLLLDEVFGKSNFVNEIIWSYKSGGRSIRNYPRKHDTILFYRKTAQVYFDIAAVGVPRGPERRNHMKRYVDDNGRICYSIRTGGKLYTYYEDTPVYPTDVWTDIEHLQQRDKERVGYATQKPEALLRRILSASSRPGDLVMDLFSGSGTTAAAASKLGRRFLAADVSPLALYTFRARQLNNGAKLSLLEGSHELELSYPADESLTGSVTTAVQRSAGKLTLTVSGFTFRRGKKNVPAYPPVYAALGTVSGDCFKPLRVDCAPVLPLKLEIPEVEQPVLQLTDAAGNQLFWQIEE